VAFCWEVSLVVSRMKGRLRLMRVLWEGEGAYLRGMFPEGLKLVRVDTVQAACGRRRRGKGLYRDRLGESQEGHPCRRVEAALIRSGERRRGKYYSVDTGVVSPG